MTGAVAINVHTDGLASEIVGYTQAKLILTYSYDKSSAAFTNQVIYPLESTRVGDQGTMQNYVRERIQDPAEFTVLPEIAESNSKTTRAHFETNYGANNIIAAKGPYSFVESFRNAVTSTAKVSGINGGGQGNGWHAVLPSSTKLNPNQLYRGSIRTQPNARNFLVGGEVFTTYKTKAGSPRSTKTVRIPIGQMTQAGTPGVFTTVIPVYLPEDNVLINKTWLRMRTGSRTASVNTVSVSTEVNGSQSVPVGYDIATPAMVVKDSQTIYHVLGHDQVDMIEQFASADTPVEVEVEVTTPSSNIKTSSGELLLTYSYDSNSSNYQQSHAVFAGQQQDTPSSTFSAVSNSGLPTPLFANIERASGMMDVSLVQSGSTGGSGAMPANGTTYVQTGFVNGAGGCSTNDSSAVSVDGANMLSYLFAGVSEQYLMSALDSGQVYTTCTTTNNPVKNTVAAKTNTQLVYMYQVNAPVIEQVAYRVFEESSQAEVTTPLAVQDAPVTLSEKGQQFRLRALLRVTDGVLVPAASSFKLQFAEKTGPACDHSLPWSDVSATTEIAYASNRGIYDESPVVVSPLDPVAGSQITVAQSYQEMNPMSTLQLIDTSAGLWDFAIVDNNAPANNSYCLRVTGENGDLLDNYSIYPEVTVSS